MAGFFAFSCILFTVTATGLSRYYNVISECIKLPKGVEDEDTFYELKECEPKEYIPHYKNFTWNVESYSCGESKCEFASDFSNLNEIISINSSATLSIKAKLITENTLDEKENNSICHSFYLNTILYRQIVDFFTNYAEPKMDF